MKYKYLGAFDVQCYDDAIVIKKGDIVTAVEIAVFGARAYYTFEKNGIEFSVPPILSKNFFRLDD